MVSHWREIEPRLYSLPPVSVKERSKPFKVELTRNRHATPLMLCPFGRTTAKGDRIASNPSASEVQHLEQLASP